MPTPAGHAIGGLAAALLINSAVRRPRMSGAVLLAAAGAAMTPDLDLLVGMHRMYTHSIAAIPVVAAIAWAVLRLRGRPSAGADTAAIASAYASHILLDWLGRDGSSPPGLMVLWPFSSAFYISGCEMFGEVSRRYWLPNEFILGNLKAFLWELGYLTPVLLAAWVLWSGRTVEGKD